MNKNYVTLSEALKNGRLQEFVRQQEERIAVSPDKRHFDALVKQAVKAPLHRIS